LEAWRQRNQEENSAIGRCNAHSSLKDTDTVNISIEGEEAKEIEADKVGRRQPKHVEDEKRKGS